VDPLFTTALTVFGVLASAYLTYRVSNRKLKTDSSQQMIDQHQEDIAELRKEVAKLERNQRIQGDYIGQLRRHIADGQPPPPPAWPDGLIT
jgi:cell division protein FtsB